jgi:hypothetical protein
MKFPITAYGTPDLRLRLKEQRVPAGLGQPVGRHQPVVTGSDDDRIHLTRQRHLLTLEGRPRSLRSERPRCRLPSSEASKT